MGHDGPWWTQLDWCTGQLALEAVKDFWNVLWCATFPHSVWNFSFLRGCTWIFPPEPEPSALWISSTTMAGLPPPLTEQDSHHQTLKLQHQALLQDPMNGDYILSTFIPSLAFACFFLSPSTSYLLLNKNSYYWFHPMVLFAPHFEQTHFSNNFNIWIIILLKLF